MKKSIKKFIKNSIKIFTISLTVWAVIENFYTLRIRREKAGMGFKAVHIGDVHSRLKSLRVKKILSAVKKCKPDIIFLTGDIVSRTEGDFTGLSEFLGSLSSVAPVYAVFGNHEQDLPEEEIEKLVKIYKKSGVRLLRNESISVRVGNGGAEITVAGAEARREIYKKDGSYRNLDTLTLADAEELLGKRCGGRVFLLSHNPMTATAFARWGADFILSGHVHGGVVRIFGVGLLSPERKFFPKYTKGLYGVCGKKLLVTSGVGKLRLFNPPEIVLYT